MMSPEFIIEASTIVLAIVGAAVALGAMLVPGQRAIRQEMGRLGDRMTRLEERMDRMEGCFAGFLQRKRGAGTSVVLQDRDR